MRTNKAEKNKKDFSIIFQEIEKYHMSDASIQDNLLKEEDLEQDESIRAFGEICREISSEESTSLVFLTFS